MTAELAALEVLGLTKLDRLELAKEAGEDGLIRFKDAGDGQDEHGDLGLVTATVLISLAALNVLVVWGVRHGKRLTVKTTRTITFPDGSSQAETIDIRFRKEWSDPEALKHLASKLRIDLDSLTE